MRLTVVTSSVAVKGFCIASLLCRRSLTASRWRLKATGQPKQTTLVMHHGVSRVTMASMKQHTSDGES